MKVMFNTISTVRVRGKWGMFHKTDAQIAVSMKCKKAGCKYSPYSTTVI